MGRWTYEELLSQVHDMRSCSLSLSSPHSWSMKIYDLTSERSLGEEHKGRSASAIFLGENNIISRLHWPLLNDITCISTIFEPEWLWSIPCPRKAFSPPQVAPRTILNLPHSLLRKSTTIQNTWPPPKQTCFFSPPCSCPRPPSPSRAIFALPQMKSLA